MSRRQPLTRARNVLEMQRPALTAAGRGPLISVRSVVQLHSGPFFTTSPGWHYGTNLGSFYVQQELVVSIRGVDS